jgi:P4 family phage/plasmid primase-like protien
MSDVALAQTVWRELTQEFGEIVQAEGNIYAYRETHWVPLTADELRRRIHRLDGARLPNGRRIALSRARIDGVINELHTMVAHGEFFVQQHAGINCSNGFVAISRNGSAALEAHSRSHRRRHVLPGRWELGRSSGGEGTLLRRFLDGCFRDDPDRQEKADLLAEVAGAAALGIATSLTEPKALVLLGGSAANGKSQCNDLIRCLLPIDAVTSISPANFGDRTLLIGLQGALLNVVDELAGSDVIGSDIFKRVITGDPIRARDVYKSAIEFRPVAQHIFATNQLPAFRGGIDRGVRRRLMLLTFNRVIPRDERVAGIGRQIAEREPDELLAWAVDGARRLMRQGRFTEPPSSLQAMQEWLLSADPVEGWLQTGEVTIIATPGPADGVRTKSAYASFTMWATAEGYRSSGLPAIAQFVRRVQQAEPRCQYVRRADGAYFQAMRVQPISGYNPTTAAHYANDALWDEPSP